ncbi:MobF family relaxase [Cellulomonas sp. PhB143]|uniref:MobF family relaxase n=1 Tax=Cellulomonas sp. PhB143 TaxID=2485186 RepID=UPI000FB74BA3|nr:MobF family relaxase [Cellulomonas sp. PhB143]ROS73071.1 conjugative relaxase-like TrwC/TraI family protein [Cellulomonas sp. PhB143]
MTVSLRVISAGQGYAYLLRSVVAGDGNEPKASVFTRYFTEAGTPPGMWMGRGVQHLGDGVLQPEITVMPSQLQALLGHGVDPVTGESLGRPFREYPTAAERTARRIHGVDRMLPGAEFDAAVARIQAQEQARGSQTATAGFDLTFSVPKSVSVLWGLADATTQELIVAAHHDAVGQVLDFFEREVAATRTGHGGAAQVPVVGVAATAYDHWDSRSNDPQLHTHLVISNKVKAAHDGQWRTLDSRALHHAVVAVSEHYNAVLADRLTNTFGIGWQRRERGADRSAQWEIAGVPDDLLVEFSSRSRDIEVASDQLIADYTATHGRRPSARVTVKLRAQATLATRPEKSIHSLADLTAAWRRRAEHLVGDDPTGWARGLAKGRSTRVLTVDAVPLDVVDQLAVEVVAAVSQKRSTWQRWNLWAEASRRTMGLRFATVEDREQVVAMITDAATRRSVQLTPGELASSPATLRREDGSSMLRPRHGEIFTSDELLRMEDRLLALAADRTGTGSATRLLHRNASPGPGEPWLDVEQAEAVRRILVSGRSLDVLVGPAGTGKTTTMRALLNAWVAEHGTGAVVGMAPSAIAAQVLAEDLGIRCDNTAKWIYDHRHGRADFRPGQLVIVDEATLTSTRDLDFITTGAAQVGAKVVLVGDPAQLQSVDAGGAFAMLVAARGDDVPRLTEVHRFTHDWEKTASLRLRDGDAAVVDRYETHDRIREGSTDEMVDAAYAAWRHDVDAGRASVLVTGTADTVRQLNDRARAERIRTGLTSAGRDVVLRDDRPASAGDVIITRRNDRRLRAGRRGWVRNGDRWIVTHVRRDGGLEVSPEGRRRGSMVLPSSYVADHVDLGYAVTAHRAQGLTVDTAHVVVSSSSTRENLYVSMTRGRDANTAYVALDRPDPLHVNPADPDVTARSVMLGVVNHTGTEASAHQVIETEENRWTSIRQLAAEYETIANAAQCDRWTRLVQHVLRDAGRLTSAETDQAIHSEAFGVLAAGLRQAEACGRDVETLLPQLVAQRGLFDADDVAAVLATRLAHVASRPAQGTRADLIAGLIPAARGPLPDDYGRALEERRRLIETRSRNLAEIAVRDHAPWTRRFGRPPNGAKDRERWLAELTAVAAYRERYAIAGAQPLGSPTKLRAQERDRRNAAAALHRAARSVGRKGVRIAGNATRSNAVLPF